MASWKSSSVSTCGIQIPREEEPTGGGLWFLSAGSTFKRGTLRSSNPEVGNHDGGKGALLLWLSLLQLANKQKVQIPLWIIRETMLSLMRELGWGGEQNPCIPAEAGTRWRAASLQDLSILSGPCSVYLLGYEQLHSEDLGGPDKWTEVYLTVCGAEDSAEVSLSPPANSQTMSRSIKEKSFPIRKSSRNERPGWMKCSSSSWGNLILFT